MFPFHFRPLVRRANGRSRLNIELLEQRRNPVTASWDMSTGVLDITGTGDRFNDRILVRQNANGISVFDNRSGRPVVVPINTPGGPTGTIMASSITGIFVHGTGGNDLIDLNSGAAGF